MFKLILSLCLSCIINVQMSIESPQAVTNYPAAQYQQPVAGGNYYGMFAVKNSLYLFLSDAYRLCTCSNSSCKSYTSCPVTSK